MRQALRAFGEVSESGALPPEAQNLGVPPVRVSPSQEFRFKVVPLVPPLIGGYIGYRRGKTFESTAIGAAIGVVLPMILMLTVGMPFVNDPITLELQRRRSRRLAQQRLDQPH